MGKRLRHGLLTGGLEDPADMYVTGGYKPATSFEEIMSRVCSIRGIEGAGFCESRNLTEKAMTKATAMLRDSGRELVGLFPDVTAGPYCQGSISAPDPRTRRMAIEHVKRFMDLAQSLNAPLVGLWMGNDGTDYYFAADYKARWSQIIDGLREICDHDPSVKISICNKTKEPRTHCHISTMGKLVALIKEVGVNNLGITLDPGHSIQNYELVGENVAFIDRFLGRDKIFTTLFSDNWRAWDDMIIPGSVNTIEWIEYLFWLDRVEYDGWVLSDEVAFREDVVRAFEVGIDIMNGLYKVMTMIDKVQIQEAMDRSDPIKALDIVRRVLLPKV